jgi:hypothetical protein
LIDASINDISHRFGAAMHSRPYVAVVPALTAVLLTMALTFALTAAPPEATASAGPTGSPRPAADTITIRTPVAVIALGGAGGEQLAVTADSTTALVSMTVHLLAPGTGTGTGSGADVLDLVMTPPAGGAEQGTSTWTSQAITQQTLPLGSYSITVDAADQGGTTQTGVTAGTFHFQDTPRIAQAAGDYVISGSNKHPVIDGTVTELAPGATEPTPYANQPIVLDDPVAGDIALTTDGAGAYRAALGKPVAGETITTEILATAATVAAKAKPVTLTVRTAITGFAANLNPYWQLSFRGCLGLAPGTPGTSGTPGSAGSPAGLIIQYSAGPHGPWHPLGAVASRRGAACGDNGRTFTGVLPARLSNAYYRASYPGTAAKRPNTGDLPSVSPAVHAWKYVTRVAHFAVSRRTVTSGGKLTTTGRLQYYAGGRWHGLAHKVVQIILLPRGSRTWYWIARVATNATGHFTATFVDPVTATWSAEYLGDKTHLAAVGAMIGVTLTG